jgi:hypothetical protein
MRWTGLALTAIGLSAAALAAPPYVNELMLPTGGITAPSDKMLPRAIRGQFLGVACAKVELAAAEAVQVVLYLAPNEKPTGYKGVLATEQTVTPGTVHVRVPDMPELAEHTVRIQVYYSDAGGRHTCDAGKVRIV